MRARPSSSGRRSRNLDCPACGKQTRTASEKPVCLYCGQPLPEYLASAILSPNDEKMDETLSASLAAPLPEEVLRKTGNPANLFGKYVLLRELGRGATGSVVLAWDTYLSRTVALKFLHSTASRSIELNDEQRVQEFLREARLAARLHHRNIVQIHEVDCRDGRFYISMDYISGGTLAELIHGPSEKRVRTRFYLEPARFLALLRKIALAVHHAHLQDPPVVHRDLKPQNVLVDEQDNPYVADFGLAGEARGVAEGPGGIRGTPAYMAPEQALGRIEEIDPRTDVYALGIILYEMLTGETPFHGENIPSVLRKIAFEPPEAPSELVSKQLRRSREVASCPPEVRAALERICLKAISKERERRQPSALEFAGELDAALPGPDAIAPPAPPSKRSTLRMVLAGAALAALLVLVLPARFRSGSPAVAQPPAPGEELVLQAEGFRSSGQWPALRGAVAELARRAPGNPRLREFQALLATRDAAIDRLRKDYGAALARLEAGPDVPDLTAFRSRLRDYPEAADDFRAARRAAIDRLQMSLLADVRETAANGPGPAWTTDAVKKRAGALHSRIDALLRSDRDGEDGLDRRALAAALPVLDRVLAWTGLWSLRVNVTPFAEVRLMDGARELARDFTPSLLRDLVIQPGEMLELCWPSQRDPQRRWTTSLPPLRPGTVLVVTGDLRDPELQVERE